MNTSLSFLQWNRFKWIALGMASSAALLTYRMSNQSTQQSAHLASVRAQCAQLQASTEAMRAQRLNIATGDDKNNINLVAAENALAIIPAKPKQYSMIM